MGTTKNKKTGRFLLSINKTPKNINNNNGIGVFIKKAIG